VDLLITQFIIGTVAVILFQYGNPQKRLLNFVSVFVLALFLSKALIEIYEWGFSFWIASAIAFSVSYSFRFVRKEIKRPFDWFKILGAMFVIFYPLSTDKFDYELRTVGYFLDNLTIPILAIIHVYDRLIVKPQMKKRYIIILSVQTAIIVLLLTFSILQKAEKDKQTMRAMEERERALELEFELQRMKTEIKNKPVP
jgi:hypothetical protein